LLVILAVCVALGGPGSMIGFDYARTFNPPGRQGTATGIVNVGGFVASLITILLIGLVLDAMSPDGEFTPEAFRVAWTVQIAVGVAGVLRNRALARRHAGLTTGARRRSRRSRRSRPGPGRPRRGARRRAPPAPAGSP